MGWLPPDTQDGSRIEAVSFPAAQPGEGKIRFNEAAGIMTRILSSTPPCFTKISGLDISEFDLHINVIGGANIEMTFGWRVCFWLIQCLEKIPLRQDIVVSGELLCKAR